MMAAFEDGVLAERAECIKIIEARRTEIDHALRLGCIDGQAGEHSVCLCDELVAVISARGNNGVL
jgi:hypothetical protein